MTTALIPIDDMDRMAHAIAKSGLFGMKAPEQVLALMLIANAEGRHPAIVARDYDIIQGRPAKKAEAMLRDFLDAGGKVEWHRLDDECADATFSHPQGGSVRINWDHARAKKAGLSGRDMYTKYARQMLRSRCVSEGCKTVYPAATSGFYEPGEVRQIAKEEKDMGKAEVVKEEDWTTGIPTESAAPQVSSVTQIPDAEPSTGARPEAAAPKFINADQAIALEDRCKEVGGAGWTDMKFKLLSNVSKRYKHPVTTFGQILASDYDDAMAWLDARDKALQP